MMSLFLDRCGAAAALLVAGLVLMPRSANGQSGDARPLSEVGHREDPVPSPHPAARRANPAFPTPVRPAVSVSRGGITSVQVNVDADGLNIVGDAANEPSIARSATSPGQMVIGWRQFDTIANSFRQAGYGVTADGGLTWSFPGVLEPNEFSSDPVLDYDLDGNIFYYALQPNRGPGEWACYMYRSSDGGVTWPQEVYAFGGDKQWFTIDRTNGIGSGNLYAYWNIQFSCCGGEFTRSTSGGATFEQPRTLPVPLRWGTLSVGPDGELYIVGINSNNGICTVIRSDSAKDADLFPQFEQIATIPGLTAQIFAGPNPGGLLGQLWIATDHSDGPTRGNVYVAGSTTRGGDPLDVGFSRSEDGGATWSAVQVVNTDAALSGAWQWFPTMSVAPNGRIDLIWNDTRDNRVTLMTTVYGTSSVDGGNTWSPEAPLTPAFDPFVGWPQQQKIGDYYQMISDNLGADLAYTATFNGEQDVYHLRIGSGDCNGNGVPDDEDVLVGGLTDCDGNLIPDECQPDCDMNGTADSCDIDAGEPDGNGNGVPDVCECVVADAPVAALADSQSRYITITPQSAGELTALRVTLDVLHAPSDPPVGTPDFSSFEGQVRWVGPPAAFPEGISGPPNFFAAQLQCEPYYADWSEFGTISVYGEAIVPSSTYTVQAIDDRCAGLADDESRYSSALPMITSRWGDVTDPFNPPTEFAQPDIADVLLIVDKFLGAFPPLKSSAQLLGNVPNPAVKPDINDILLCVDSFLGKPYPYAGPSGCP